MTRAITQKIKALWCDLAHSSSSLTWRDGGPLMWECSECGRKRLATYAEDKARDARTAFSALRRREKELQRIRRWRLEGDE